MSTNKGAQDFQSTPLISFAQNVVTFSDKLSESLIIIDLCNYPGIKTNV